MLAIVAQRKGEPLVRFRYSGSRLSDGAQIWVPTKPPDSRVARFLVSMNGSSGILQVEGASVWDDCTMTMKPLPDAVQVQALTPDTATDTSADRFWERHARKYDRVTLFLNRRFPLMAGQVAQDLAGRGRVLEIAAGTGLVTVPLASQVGQLVATDRSPEMLEVLSGRLSAHSLNAVTVKVADVFDLPFAPGEFDAAVIANLLHLLPNPERALREIRRVLKPNAILAAPTFQHGASAIAQITSRGLGLAGFPVQTRFRDRMLPDLIERAGYKVERVQVFPGILPLCYVLASLRPEREDV